jgi:hypothetical protein
VHWRRPADWAKELYRFVREQGLEDTVTTFHELACGDDTKGAGARPASLLRHSAA